jgi:hypothetical protein
VDYAILSENLEKHVKSFHVLKPDTGSDHCPIKLELNCPRSPETTDTNITAQLPKYRWNDMTKHLFSQQINSNVIISKIENLESNIDMDSTEIDSHVEELTNIFKKSLESKLNRHRIKKHKPKKQKKAWYDKSCYEIGKRLKLVAKLVSNSPNDPYLRGSLVKTRKE